jgi:acyl-CoA reductase-like NAD-dependent aldehyde dehydrogenase
MRAVSAELKSAPTRVSAFAGVLGSGGLAEAALPADVQTRWAATPLRERLRVVRAGRQRMASRAEDFAAAISPLLARNKADTLVTELLPLLDACRFLEREAIRLLAPRKLGRRGRPLWLSGVAAEIHREPLGHVLVIGPSNFPLFLPGVQAIQALVAGNIVTWKPGAGGGAVALLVAEMLHEAGLLEGVLTVTDDSVEAAQRALAAKPDKVVFTGSAKSGESVLCRLAETATPAVVELSGADAIVVTPSADLAQVAKVVAFGLRLNGGAVCMSPRRLFATPTTMSALRPLLDAELANVPAVLLNPATSARLRSMLDEAVAGGAMLRGALEPGEQKPILVDHAEVRMAITRSDLFAPVISLIEAESMLHVPELYAECPYALTVSIFCGQDNQRKARALATVLKAGTVLINDVIAPTADPRVPFGGRGASGYGITRGAEGLLEMTAVKTLLIRRGGAMRHLDATSDEDTQLFAALICAMHGKGLVTRWAALKQIVTSARRSV